MLSVETKINGKLIGRARIENLRRMGDGRYFYHVEYAQLDGEQKKLNFDVIHDREEGEEELVFLIYQEAVKRLK